MPSIWPRVPDPLDTVRGNPRVHLYFLPTPWTRCGATPVSTCTFFLRLGHGAGTPPCPLVLSSYALDTVRGNPRVHLYFLPTPWTRCGATPVSTCTFFLRLGHGAGQPPCPLVLSSYALDTVRGNPRVPLYSSLRSWLVSPGRVRFGVQVTPALDTGKTVPSRVKLGLADSDSERNI